MRCQLAKLYGLLPQFTHCCEVHIAWQSLMMLCYACLTFLDANDAIKFHFLEIVAPAMHGVAGALPCP